MNFLLSSNVRSSFTKVLYTGGSRVGSIVLTAAAKTLSPVTTEVSVESAHRSDLLTLPTARWQKSGGHRPQL
jgi:hypothetical protein